ncbi:hypothetical protein [Clostridium sp. YIM B02500]|uniref:hypothetical protein n=1 Tax=Clostridium sp. YIM B02500 TaxID=2910681 RepID=UPI001EED73DE|nr:hypothetical protein [Clostridium sp. YIM B02500]
MDKVILNNGTTLNVELIAVLTNGLALTFTNQTVDNLETLMTTSNLSSIKLATSSGDVYGTYNNLSCLSIAKMIESGNIVVTLYQESALEERVTTLEAQNSEVLLALVRMGGM